MNALADKYRNIRYREAMREFQIDLLTDALIAASGNACEASRRLGMHRNTFSRILEAEGGPQARELRVLLREAGRLAAPEVAALDPKFMRTVRAVAA